MTRYLTILATVTLTGVTTLITVACSSSAPPVTPSFTPIRAAFYDPWYPETWHEASDRETAPVLGQYRSDDATILEAHVAEMRYAGLAAAISTWWGVGHATDDRLDSLQIEAAAGGLSVTAYYELETYRNRSAEQVSDDLAYLAVKASRPGWLKADGKPVLFIDNANPATGCDQVETWVDAAAEQWYLNLKVFNGYATCDVQPDSWHENAPEHPLTEYPPHSSTISPGFHKWSENEPRLKRNLARFKSDLSRQTSSGTRWQLTASFNGWGEGSAVEPATQWQSESGMGLFLDAMRAAYGGARPTPAPIVGVATGDSVTIVAAGDIACDPEAATGGWECAQALTAKLIGELNPSAVLALGDTQYDSGTPTEYASYADSWGAYLPITWPVAGNHEWRTPGAEGYLKYFEERIHGKFYYGADLGAGWRLVALDSNCSDVGGCDVGSPQHDWLVRELAAHDGKPTVVIWHHPRWSSGEHDDQIEVDPLWDTLVEDKDVQMVLAGHDHDYERFAPMGTGDTVDPSGLRQFVVGTGGKNHYCDFDRSHVGSEVFNCDTYGVLSLTLGTDRWDWKFIPAPGTGDFNDHGTSAFRK